MRHPMKTPRALLRSIAVGAFATALLGGSVALGQAPSPTSTSDSLSLLGLGDSLPGAMGCFDPCRSYVEVYGDLASDALGTVVETTNLATNDGLTSEGLIPRVTGSEAYRTAIAGADLITLQVGFNDWQGSCGFDGMAECLAAGTARVDSNVSTILDEIVTLRAGAPTVIRVVTPFDPFVGASQTPVWWSFDPSDREAFDEVFEAALTDFNIMLCRVAEQHDAVCIDTRTPVNGPGWDVEALPEPADGAIVLGGDDHLHLTKVGHELVAQAIADAGFAPLE